MWQFSIADNLFIKLKALGDRHSMSVLEVIQFFIKLGFTMVDLMEDPNAEVIVREGDEERVLTFQKPVVTGSRI